MTTQFDTSVAKLTDIKDLLKIQISRSLHFAVKNGEVEDSLMRNGFLVHTLSEEEISYLINRKGVYFIVRRDSNNVVGYALGYNFGIWKELNPGWYGSIKFKNEESQNTLTDDATIYFRHVATIPSDDHATGLKLSKELFELATSKYYNCIVGEILKEPFFNNASYKIHTRLGAEDIGEVEEVYGGKHYKWTLLKKDLVTKDRARR